MSFHSGFQFHCMDSVLEVKDEYTRDELLSIPLYGFTCPRPAPWPRSQSTLSIPLYGFYRDRLTISMVGVFLFQFHCMDSGVGVHEVHNRVSKSFNSIVWIQLHTVYYPRFYHVFLFQFHCMDSERLCYYSTSSSLNLSIPLYGFFTTSVFWSVNQATFQFHCMDSFCFMLMVSETDLRFFQFHCMDSVSPRSPPPRTPSLSIPLYGFETMKAIDLRKARCAFNSIVWILDGDNWEAVATIPSFQFHCMDSLKSSSRLTATSPHFQFHCMDSCPYKKS